MTLAVILAGLGAGLASLPHCAAMCGPLAAAACARRPASSALPRWQAGRLVAYAILGAIAGGAGTLLVGAGASRWAPALVSWSCAVALAFAAARVWPWQARPRALVALGRRTATSPLAGRVLAATARSPMLFGAATALLPCGALATAVLLAASTASATGGALSMTAFAIASAPGLLGFGLVAGALARVHRAPTAARVLALILVAGALLLLARPMPALIAGAPRCPACATAPVVSP